MEPHARGLHAAQNLIIEDDNFDSLRLLRSTHAGRIRVIYIDPLYNTGNKDWVYNDSYGAPMTAGGTASGWISLN